MLIIGRRELALAAGIICSLAISAAGIGIYRNTEVFEQENPISVIVDAGHGDPDGGAVGVNGTLEKDINLDIALKLREVLEGKDMNVVMTRMGDRCLADEGDETLREMKRSDMKKRAAIMQNSGADLFVSIHMNSYSNGSAQGLHIFYAKNHPEIQPMAEKIQERIAAVTNAQTHTVKTADESLFLMKSPPIPAILAECGFLSNAVEERKLNDDDYRSRIAWAIAEGIEEYFQENQQETPGK